MRPLPPMTGIPLRVLAAGPMTLRQFVKALPEGTDAEAALHELGRLRAERAVVEEADGTHRIADRRCCDNLRAGLTFECRASCREACPHMVQLDDRLDAAPAPLSSAARKRLRTFAGALLQVDEDKRRQQGGLVHPPLPPPGLEVIGTPDDPAFDAFDPYYPESGVVRYACTFCGATFDADEGPRDVCPTCRPKKADLPFRLAPISGDDL